MTAQPGAKTHALPPLVIVSGMSGSGKSVALNTFEDLPRDGRCVADYWF